MTLPEKLPVIQLLDLVGKTGGPRISRPRADWDSGARVKVTRDSGAWFARLDIPIERAANILGETGVPSEFRILLMRNRLPRVGEPRESSVIPPVLGETAVNPARYRRMQLTTADAVPIPITPIPVVNAFRSLETNVLTPAERKERNITQMLDSHLRQRVLRVVEAEAQEWSQVQSLPAWERFRDRRIGALRRFIGEMPTRVSLESQIAKEYHGQGYRRLDILYRSRPTLWIAANLYHFATAGIGGEPDSHVGFRGERVHRSCMRAA